MNDYSKEEYKKAMDKAQKEVCSTRSAMIELDGPVPLTFCEVFQIL